ncbi:hypothetical protein [Kitasatospora sp. NE20-6]|uniref:hypothetical protein n=1 Tax=Kitasatospora sp. NE20-6 TaxID=2859066 RepID=UPI0038B3BF56
MDPTPDQAASAVERHDRPLGTRTDGDRQPQQSGAAHPDTAHPDAVDACTGRPGPAHREGTR